MECAYPWPWAVVGPAPRPRPRRARGPVARPAPPRTARTPSPFPLSLCSRARLSALSLPISLLLHRGAHVSASPPFFSTEPRARGGIQRHHSPLPAFKLRLMEAINRPSSRLDARLNRPSVRPLSAPTRHIKLAAEPPFPPSVCEPRSIPPKFSVPRARWTLRACAALSPDDTAAVGTLPL